MYWTVKHRDWLGGLLLHPVESTPIITEEASHEICTSLDGGRPELPVQVYDVDIERLGTKRLENFQQAALGQEILHEKLWVANDAYAYAMVRWVRFLEGGFDPYPDLSQFMENMSSDPGVIRALERETG